ncbi:MAG: Flp pilus assembly complex ATPase component TadA [Bacilli bacterium]|nr:Flp pilus assembly complex ATPase component TadA [Bacilli bacterium]
MEEAMNLNGMGQLNNQQVPQIPIPTQQQEPAPAPVVEETAPPEPTPASTENTEPVKANNDLGFEDLDMVQELRDEEELQKRQRNESIFSSMEFGPLKKFLEDDDVTDISYSNGGQLWLKTLSKGVYRVEEPGVNDSLIEKIAFQCSNVMGKTFNMAHPFLDSESAELRMNFIHESIARNGIAVVFRKTPAKIRLKKEKLMEDNYVSLSVHDFLIKAVQGHCNIIMCGETGSGKTEFLKYLASHTFENEKIVTIEDTLELHLDRIYPHRDIVAMKTNNIASYSDVLVTCMRQNPIWILLSEVRSAEAVTAVRNSISSGHFILSTIHADKASNIPYRLYSLLESNIDVGQFLNTMYRYIQLGVYLRGRFDPTQGKYIREIGEVCEFYVDDDNNCVSNVIYQKTISGEVTYKPISEHLLQYIEGQGIDISNIRESNGNLEKIQNYDDELSAEGQENKEEKEEKVETTPVVDEKKVDPPKEDTAPPVAQEAVVEEKKEVQPQVASVEKPKEEVVNPIPQVQTTTVEVKTEEQPKVVVAPQTEQTIPVVNTVAPPVQQPVQQAPVTQVTNNTIPVQNNNPNVG